MAQTATKKKKKLPAPKAELLPATGQKSERNMGVELFRIVSMILVILLHVLGHGGVRGYSEHLSTNYLVARFLETVAYCSVNCYAIISGFANVKSKFKFRRFIHLWLETVVLLAVSLAFVDIFVPSVEVAKEWWLGAFFPLTRRELWYLCAYFFMFPLIPLLNKGLLALNRWQHILVIVWLQAPTIFKLIMNKDNYVLGAGYSAIWLICLYVIGAYFRIYGAPKWAKWFVTLPTFLIAAIIPWLKLIYAEMQYKEGLLEKTSELYQYRDNLISYVSPFMVIMATMLLIFFMQVKIRFKPTKFIISNLGKSTWGIFVLHVGSAGWYWEDLWHYFRKFADYPTPKMLLAVFVTVMLIFLITALITLDKIYLFKLFRIDQGIEWLADLPAKLVAHVRKKQGKPLPEGNGPTDPPANAS